MSDLSAIAGMAEIIRIGGEDGKDYKFTPVTISDFADFEAQARKWFKEEQKERIAELVQDLEDAGVTGMERVEEIRKLRDKKVDPLGEMGSIRGLQYLFYLGLRGGIPGLKLEDAGGIVPMASDVLEEVLGAIMPGHDFDDVLKKKMEENPNPSSPGIGEDSSITSPRPTGGQEQKS